MIKDKSLYDLIKAKDEEGIKEWEYKASHGKPQLLFGGSKK